MINWKDRKVAILGFGVEGISTAKYLAKKGAHITVFDQKEKEQLDTRQKETLKDLQLEFIGGPTYLDAISGFEFLVRSPGISRFRKELVDAQQKGIEITSHTQIFLDECPGRVIGVTGTKGKGTTSTLIYEMLRLSEKDLVSVIKGVFLGGNIGNPPLEFLDQITEKSVVVLELSSFQLDGLIKSPHIAVMLMVVPEHLNYHKNMEEYVAAKRNILAYQENLDFAIINRDYIASSESDIHTQGNVFYVSRERSTTEQGCFLKDNAVWIAMQGTEWKIIDIEDIALLGKHNLENACAAAMAATLAGASKSDIASVLRTFTGLEHRLELVGEVGGVKYYDDSFSTTPETAIAAIESFNQPEILILGGSSKESDFSELGELIGRKDTIKAIIGIGEEWPRIREQIAKGKEEIVVIEGARDMKTIVQAASKIALPGDVVLLSPACASFDMFKNYKVRGEQFKEAVNKL